MKWLKRIFRKIFNKKSKIPKYVDLGNGLIGLEGYLYSGCKSIIYVNHTETSHLTVIRREVCDCRGCIFCEGKFLCSYRIHIADGYSVRPCIPISHELGVYYKLVRSSDILEEI